MVKSSEITAEKVQDMFYQVLIDSDKAVSEFVFAIDPASPNSDYSSGVVWSEGKIIAPLIDLHEEFEKQKELWEAYLSKLKATRVIEGDDEKLLRIHKFKDEPLDWLNYYFPNYVDTDKEIRKGRL